jgi:hypothetical protein
VTDITRAIVITLGRVASITRDIVMRSVTPRSITRAIVINSHGFNTPVGQSLQWSLWISIGGVDYSNRLTGRVSVQRAVNAATLADFSLIPVAGAIDPTAFDGLPVVMTYQDARGTAQLFKGLVIRPSITMSDKTIRLVCSDLLQETFSKLSTAQINALIPHQRSSALYQDPADNYDYALECLNSAEGDIFLGIDNEPVYKAWTDENQLTFNSSNVLYESVNPTFADRHTLTNKIIINFDYRHFIGWHRKHDLNWSIGMTYFAWLSGYFSTLPAVEIIEKAIPGDCVIASKTITPPPPSGLYGSGVDVVAYVNGYPDGYAAFAYSAEAAERWLQTITRKITLTVSSSASITRYGEIVKNAKYALSNDEDSIDFTKINDNRRFGVSAGFDNSGPVTVSDKDPFADPDAVYIDWRVITYRKKLYGKNGTVNIANAAINCALREAGKTILQTHQNVSINFECVIQPLLTLANNGTINAEGVTAAGRIKQFEHRLDFDAGTAQTSIQIVPVSGTVNQTLTVPTLIDYNPVVTNATSPALKTYLDTGLGAPADNENWRGYIANTVSNDNYQARFVVEIPEIAAALRDEQTIEQSAAFNVSVILDKIGLTA